MYQLRYLPLLKTPRLARNEMIQMSIAHTHVLTSIQPHPLYRLARGTEENEEGISLLCAAGCAPTPHLATDATCNGAWAPNYVALGDSGCECLTEYKCCDGTCPPINKESCWGQGAAEKGKEA